MSLLILYFKKYRKISRNMGKTYTSNNNCELKGTVTYRFCPRETSYGRFSGETPPPLSVVYKSINVHLGQGPQDLIMSVKMYQKYKYTYENVGFCILCMGDFKIVKILSKLSKFSTIFRRETSQAPTPPLPPPPNVHMTFLVDKIHM